MRITWSRLAVDDRSRIIEHVPGDSPKAALALDDRIVASIGRLAAFPASGRLGRVAGTRELVVAGTPFLVAHMPDGDGIRILRVLHGARRWPDGDA